MRLKKGRGEDLGRALDLALRSLTAKSSESPWGGILVAVGLRNEWVNGEERQGVEYYFKKSHVKRRRVL